MKIKIINTTTDSEDTASYISKLLLNEKLSPCVQIIPRINSLYIWKGKIEESQEFLLIIKTTVEMLEKCKELIIKHHNYDIPELITIDGELLYDNYKDWFIHNS